MTTFDVPEHVGSGLFQSLRLGSHATWAWSDLTPRRNTFIDEQGEHAGVVLAFNLMGEQRWRNRDTGREHLLPENYFGIYDGGTYAATNTYEENERSLQMGFQIAPGFCPILFEKIRETGAISSFNHVSRIAGMDIPPEARRVIQDMLGCTYSEDLREHYLQAKLMELIVVLTGELTDQPQRQLREIKLSDSDRAGLKEVKRILNACYADSPTIPELVRPAMMNENKLKRAFKQQYGKSIHAYIIEKRMEKARELLESGEVSVSEAAHQVGYTNTSYFISRFRQMYGTNPGALKR